MLLLCFLQLQESCTYGQAHWLRELRSSTSRQSRDLLIVCRGDMADELLVFDILGPPP